MKSIAEYILERNANTLPSNVTVSDNKENKTLTISFGKNGWGLSDELIKAGQIIQEYSKTNNVYISKCFIDELDDVYDFVFSYDNKHFND